MKREKCSDWLFNLMGGKFWREEFGGCEFIGEYEAKEKLTRIMRLARLYRRRTK